MTDFFADNAQARAKKAPRDRICFDDETLLSPVSGERLNGAEPPEIFPDGFTFGVIRLGL